MKDLRLAPTGREMENVSKYYIWTYSHETEVPSFVSFVIFINITYRYCNIFKCSKCDTERIILSLL